VCEQETEGEPRAALELGPGSVGPLAASPNDIFSLITEGRGMSTLQHMCYLFLKDITHQNHRSWHKLGTDISIILKQIER